MNVNDKAPVVLVIGGNDPVGGAGLCADIQALAGLGCHAAPVVTAVTCQNSCGVSGYRPVDADLVRDQIACVLEDMPVSAIKTGMLATSSVAEAISSIIGDFPEVPLIIDPVLGSNKGNPLSDYSLARVLLEQLIPLASVVTPNVPEFEALIACTGQKSMSADELSSGYGVDVLLTGTHDTTTEKVVNRLFRKNHDVKTWQWERLSGEYHGSGCTLASATAAGLAHKLDIVTACGQAQEYTWQSLAHAFDMGRCQKLPNRLTSSFSDQ